MRLLPLTLLVLGCRTTLPLDFTDQWTVTREVCDWESYREEWASELVGPADRYWAYRDAPAYPSIDCIDRVLDDFGVNVPAMLAADEEDDPYRMLEPGEEDVGRTHKLLLAARGLFLYGFGPTQEVRPSWLVSHSTMQWLHTVGEITEQESANAAMYNLLTTAIETVEPLEVEGVAARVNFETGTLHLSNIPPSANEGAYMSSLLAHEATHRLFESHVACLSVYSQDLGCDPDMERTYGAAITWQVLTARWYTDPELIDHDSIARSIWDRMLRINAFHDKDGQPLPEISDFRTELEP